MIIFKQKLKYFLPLILLVIVSSCIEEIDVDLNSSAPAIAVEGQIELDSVAWIRINHTTDYFSPTEPNNIDDAIVSITTKGGESEIMEYVGEGYYMGNSIVGVINEEYSVSIINNEINKAAVSVLYAPTEITEVVFEDINSFFKDPKDTLEYYTSKITFTDDPNIHNFYLVKYWGEESKEEKKKKDIKADSVALVDFNYYYTLIDDKYYEEDSIELSSWVTFIDSSHVKIIVYSIDEDAYTYYNQLNDLNGGDESTPYNPQSNFGTEFMGYFLVWSYDTYEGLALKEEGSL